MSTSEARPAAAIEQLLSAMEKWGASDLLVGAGKTPAVRLHGAIVALELAQTSAEEIERFVGEALSPELRARLDAHGEVSFGYVLRGEQRFRICCARGGGALGLVARRVPLADKTLQELGLPEALGTWLERSHGLLLVTGPGGSGRSTTLAALVRHTSARRAAHIVTLESPIELLLPDERARVTQRELGTDTTSFVHGLLVAAREGADVVALSELDAQTLPAALQAAARGQLVLATTCGADAVSSLSGLLATVPDGLRSALAHELAHALVGVAALRLLPRRDGGSRAAAVELLEPDPAARDLLCAQRFSELREWLEQTRAAGCVYRDAALVALCKQGVVTVETALAHAASADTLARRLRETFAAGAELPPPATGIDLRLLLQTMVRRGASDLHLSAGHPPILRVHGALQAEPLPALSASDVDAALAAITEGRQRARFAQGKELDFSMSLPGGPRFRVNAYRERGQAAVACRAIASQIPSAQDLGLPAALLRMGDEPHGLLLVVGPTGAGKTTTLACLVDRINHTRPCHVITIEDPIEYVHQSDRATIHQREVGTDTESFAGALKYILRQDPDVVLIGELRDLETISAALTAAETGHLVMATLHTNDAIQTIDRILDVFPPHQQAQARAQLAAALVGVVSQRLFPRLDGQGRLAAFEVMLATPAIQTLIREAKMHQALGVMQTSRAAGMQTMDQAIEELLRRGAIDKSEAVRYMQTPGALDRPKAKP